MNSFHVGYFQVPTLELVGSAHNEVVVDGPQPARLGQGIAASAHEVVQGSVKCQVVGIP